MTDYFNLVNFSIKAVLKKDIIKSKPFTARFKNKSSTLLDKDVTCTFTNSQY